MLALEVVGDILCVKPVADIIEHEAYYPFQQFHVADAMPLYCVAQNDGRIDVIHQLINGFEAVITRMDCRETTHAKVFLKLFSQCFFVIWIYTMKQKIFIERQRHDMETDIPACQIGGQLGGKQPGVRAGYINIYIPIHHERIDGLFPILHLLYFIQQDIYFPIGLFHFILDIQVQGFRIGNIHPFKTLKVHIDNVLFGNLLTLQFFCYQLQYD